MSDKSKKIKATEDRGSLDLTRQLDESELAFKTLKQQIKQLEREAEEMLLYP